jgi:hypothetical protein
LGPALQARETLSPIHARKRKALLAPSPAAANDAFQKAEASGRYIRTKIVTLKDRLDVGQPVHRRTWPKANELSAIRSGRRLGLAFGSPDRALSIPLQKKNVTAF